MPQIRVNAKPTTMPVKFDLYEDDVAQLDMIVDAAAACGVPRSSRAKVVRLALQRLMSVPVTELAEQLKQQRPPSLRR